MMIEYDHIYTADISSPDGLKGSIYQGSMPSVGKVVAECGFDVLVLAADENQDLNGEYEDIEVIAAPGEDIRGWPVDPEHTKIWEDASHIVADRVRAGKRVLITCMAGLNRSGMVTALTMHKLTGWDAEKIIWWIQGRRSAALFNKDFQRHLLETLKEFDL